VIAFGEGGAKETVMNALTGTFFYQQTPESLEEAINRFESFSIKSENCRRQAKGFSKEVFKKRFMEAIQGNL